jgi:hypothetical protein
VNIAANRQQQRARRRLVKIADRRFLSDMGAGVVALSPDHPTLVQWRHLQRNCDCSPVTEANRQQRLRQLNATTDTLSRTLSADKIAYAKKLSMRVQLADSRALLTSLTAQDKFTLDSSSPVAECVQTCIQVAAP